MTANQLLRAQLSSVRKELAETFPHLNDGILDWAPAPGMRTIHGQFVELLGTEQGILDRLQGIARKSSDEMDAPFWAIKSTDGLIARLDGVRQATLAYLDSLSEAELAAPFEISEGFAAWLDLVEVPVSEILRFIARHESYHAGQLVSYLWARGDNPYKWD